LGTVNVVENAPRPSVVANATVALSNLIVIGVVAVKPEPVTVTRLPGGPKVGETEIEGVGGGGGGELVTAEATEATEPTVSRNSMNARAAYLATASYVTRHIFIILCMYLRK
jgi:hypothetical protein